jgi:hypothetical protein
VAVAVEAIQRGVIRREDDVFNGPEIYREKPGIVGLRGHHVDPRWLGRLINAVLAIRAASPLSKSWIFPDAYRTQHFNLIQVGWRRFVPLWSDTRVNQPFMLLQRLSRNTFDMSLVRAGWPGCIVIRPGYDTLDERRDVDPGHPAAA